MAKTAKGGSTRASQDDIAALAKAAQQIASAAATGGSASGATISHEYLVRKRQVIGVNKDELEELRVLDLMQQAQMQIGGAIMAIPIGLILQGWYEAGEFKWEPRVLVCLLFFAIGAIIWAFGLVHWIMRLGKLNRIIDQTGPMQAEGATDESKAASKPKGVSNY